MGRFVLACLFAGCVAVSSVELMAPSAVAQAGPSFLDGGSSKVPAQPLFYYAGAPGRLTTDRDRTGGNPFATALVDVLDDPGLRLRDFGTSIAGATHLASDGWQSAQVPRRVPLPNWRFSGDVAGEDRVALVLVNSDFEAAGVSSLPGALFDAARVPEALGRAGFETQVVLDRDGAAVRAALEAFAIRSAEADVAVIYLGGHGVEHGRVVYWLMGDYPDPQSSAGLATHAFALPDVAKAARAGMLNFVMYAACRDDPFTHD